MADISVRSVRRHVLWELFFSATKLPPPYTALKDVTFSMTPYLNELPTERQMLTLTPPKGAHRKVAQAVKTLEEEGLVESVFRPYLSAKRKGGFTWRPHKWVRLTEKGITLGESLWEVRPWEQHADRISVEELRGGSKR